MKDYAAMSDFDINSAVSMALLDKSANPSARYVAIGNYCNNPEEAWPIITEYRISIIDLNDKEWGCRVEGAHGVMRAINENPLRCAMIVFLMMKEGE